VEARAYVYGKATVLEFDSAPTILVLVDEQGRRVEYERSGWLYRLPRALDHFTAWADGHATTFSAIPVTRVFSARPRPVSVGLEPEDAHGNKLAARVRNRSTRLVT